MGEGAASPPGVDSGEGVGSKLAAIMLLGALFRFAALLVTDPPLVSDALVYHELAGPLAESGSYAFDGKVTAYRPPGYPAFLAAVYLVSSSSVFWVRVVQAMADVVTCLLIFRVARRLAQPRSALTAAALYAVYLPAVLYSQVLLSETLFTMLLILLVDRLTGEGGDPRRVLFPGLLIGASAYVKPVMAVFPLALLVYDLRRGVRAKTAVRHGVLLLLVVCLVMSPWIVRNYLVFRAPLFSTNAGVNLWIGNNPGATGGFKVPEGLNLLEIEDEYRRNALAFRDAIEYVREQPLDALKLIPAKLFFLFSSESTILLHHFGWSDRSQARGSFTRSYLAVPAAALVLVNLSYYLLLLLSLPALLTGVAGGNGTRRLLTVFLVFWIGVHLVFFGSNRFHMPMMPAFAIFAGATLASWSRLDLHSSPRGRLLVGAAVLFFLVLWAVEWVALSGR